MKYSHLAISGRQQNVSLLEYAARFGMQRIEFSSDVVLLPGDVALDKLGGSQKIAEIIDKYSGNRTWKSLVNNNIVQDLSLLNQPGKVSVGVSLFGLACSKQEINSTLLSLKKQLRGQSKSIRVVPITSGASLNAAQTLHNGLHRGKGVEYVIAKVQDTTYLARVTQVQDIYAYTKRDRDKPVRDPVNGMLPPKLAQVMINACNLPPGSTILDPFCGTGTVLIEALLAGYKVVGSDIAQNMVRATTMNLAWLKQEYTSLSDADVTNITKADATQYKWPHPFDAIVAETYLGPPLRAKPSSAQLNKIIDEINDLHAAFLKNVAAQVPSGTALCLAVPAWKRSPNAIKRLNIVDDLENLGYNRVDLLQDNKPVFYHRPDALVAREILVLSRK